MPSYGETIGVKQPDDTQGIAKVELKNGSEELIAELVGCAIHLSMKDKSLRNVLQLDNKSYEEVKYFIFVPWFCSCRPKQMDEKSTKIVVKLHRYGKEQGKEFSVDENNSGGIFKKYHSNNYFVIPLPEKSSQESSFLKKWSSDLLLFNNSSQILQSKNFFYGIKKVETKKLLKFCGFKEESAKLDEQGVLLIRSSIYESYVIGCYKKENGRIKKYCFLLKGLEEIAEPARGTDNPTAEQPPSGRSEGGGGNPTAEQPPSGRSEGGGGNPTTEQPPSGRSEGGGGNPTAEQHPSGRSEGGGDNPTAEQPPSGRSEKGGDNPTAEQPPSGRSEGGGGNPTAEQPKLWRHPALDVSQESEDGQIGSKLVVVSGRHTSRPMNLEKERAKIEKKELIHKTYGKSVVDMPYDVKNEVCLMLNPIQRLKANDYRKVADEIGLTHYQIRNLAKENPMEDVFEVMISQTKKVDEFVDILFKIGRGDVVQKMYDMALHTQS